MHKSLSKMRVADHGSRNAGPRSRNAGPEMRVQKCGSYVVRDAGQLEQNAVTHLRLSEMRLAVAGREMRLRVAICELRLPNVEGLGNSMAYLCTFVTPLS